MSEREKIGTLVAVVLKGKDLPDKHTITKQDAYAQVTLNGATPHKTQIDARGGQHPVWDEEFHLPVYKDSTGNHRILEVSCWSKEPRGDDLVGSGTVDISETLRTGEFDDWIKLSNGGVQRGELYLEMTYYAAGPPPLSRRATKMKPADRLSRPSYLTSQSSGVPPKTPPKSASAAPTPILAPTLSPSVSPRAGTAHLVPPSLAPGAGSRSSSPHGSRTTSPHGPRGSSPHGVNSPLPSGPAGHGDSVPALLRPGNPHAVSHPVQPLPPNDPLHPRVSEPSRVAWPPGGAAADPPATSPLPQDALGLSQSPPSFFPPFGSHNPYSSPGQPPYTSPSPQPPYPSTSPAPPFASPGLVPGRADPMTGAPGLSFPIPHTPAPPSFAAQAPVPPYSGGGWSSSPPKPRYGAESYASPEPPSMPGGYAWNDAPRFAQPAARVQPAYTDEPSLPDPFARPHPTMSLPSGLAFRDESALETPRADVQPRHQPAVPSSHLRQEARLGYAGAGRRGADADTQVAEELERQERERAVRLSEQEQADLELARQLDKELNFESGA